MADELRIFVPTAIKAVMKNLSSRLDAVAGMPVAQIIDLNPMIPQRIVAGDPCDLGLTNPEYAFDLIKSGHAVAASHRPFGRVPLAVGGCKALHAPATSVEDLRTLFQNATSIAYTDHGTSGRIFLDSLARLGLTESVLTKCLPMPGGWPAPAAAAGKVELAVAPLTTILATPGIVPQALFPQALSTHIDMTIFETTTARPEAGRVIRYLTDASLDDELSAAGIKRFSLD